MSAIKNVAFEIDFESEAGSKTKRPPIKFTKKIESRRKTKEEIDAKHEQAETRRQAYEKAKLDRIKEINEECLKIDSKVQKLLAQDAKRKGLPGTEKIKPMSTREANNSLKSLSTDFSKLTQNITRVHVPD